jgi:hypothetical protein
MAFVTQTISVVKIPQTNVSSAGAVGGSTVWTNPTQATGISGSGAFNRILTGDETRRLSLRNPGFAIPSGKTIVDFKVNFDYKLESTGVFNQDDDVIAVGVILNPTQNQTDPTTIVQFYPGVLSTGSSYRSIAYDRALVLSSGAIASVDWGLKFVQPAINATGFGILIYGAKAGVETNNVDISIRNLRLEVLYEDLVEVPDGPTQKILYKSSSVSRNGNGYMKS